MTTNATYQSHKRRWIEEGEQDSGSKKYIGRCFKVPCGNSGGYRIVKVVQVDTYGGLLIPMCKTISDRGLGFAASFLSDCSTDSARDSAIGFGGLGGLRLGLGFVSLGSLGSLMSNPGNGR